MKYANNITELVGKTPLIRLGSYEKDMGLNCTLLAKAELFNPAGSIKDRAALSMIADAEAKGLLSRGATVIEPTSGNTGIGLAAVAATRGYKVILTMPETMSVERRKLLEAYGAEIILTDGRRGMAGAIEKAEELAKTTGNCFLAGQFVNPANSEAHYKTTAPEIWEDTDGKVDIVIAGIGTGGTITGIGRYLKEKNPDVKIIGIEPTGSPYITKGKVGAHGLQGIGAGFIPEILDMSLIDEVITVADADAYDTGRYLARHEGLMVGITSGAAVYGAKIMAERPENRGKTIVAVMPDTGMRYLSTEMFSGA